MKWWTKVEASTWSCLRSQPAWSTWTLVTGATSLSNKSVLSPWTLSSWKQNPLQSNLPGACLSQVGWVTRLPDMDNGIWSQNWHGGDSVSSMSSERVLAETCLSLNLSPLPNKMPFAHRVLLISPCKWGFYWTFVALCQENGWSGKVLMQDLCKRYEGMKYECETEYPQ